MRQTDIARQRPDSKLAAAIAASATGHAPIAVNRFTTGTSHYVFEVQFADQPAVVVRIGDSSAHAKLEGAAYLSGLLRPRGVPLPAILASDTKAAFPWLLLERLSGRDLGAVISDLSERQLDNIAVSVAGAQTIVAQLPSSGRYGYAVRPELAPYHAWSDVLKANVARARQRIDAAGLFDSDLANRVEGIIAASGAEIDAIGATPFLHDTTTKNVIVTAEGVLSGIVDVDDLCFGDPRYPMALTLAVVMAYGGPEGYVSVWRKHARQADDQLFRLYVSVFILDLMSEHGQVFNGNPVPSTAEAQAGLRRAFASNLGLTR